MTHVDQDAAGRAQGSGASGGSPDVTLMVVALAELRPAYPVSELLGRPVINDTGEEIGHIEDLMIEHDRLAFAILSVGGFLGIGAHQVVMAFDALLIDDDEVVLPGATREALKAMTVYDPDKVRRERAPLRKARPGVKDAGQVVTTAADEPIPGIVADVADGDDARRT
jgi:sporulation protein YlmC with PRC-barrel domain